MKIWLCPTVLAVLTVVLVSPGCSGETRPATPTPTSPTTARVKAAVRPNMERLADALPGTLSKTCAPWDGPAFTVIIRTRGDRPFPSALASIYESLGGPNTYTVGTRDTGTKGNAAFCPAKNKCRPASAFRLELTPSAGANAETGRAYGVLSLTLDGKELRYPFDVERGPSAAMCG